MHVLDLGRVGQLLRQRFRLQGRSLWQQILIAAGLFVLGLLLSVGDDDPGDGQYYVVYYVLLTLTGGFVFTVRSLSQLATDEGRQTFLTLPASDTEKWLATYLYTGPLFFIVFSVVYWLVTVVTSLLLGAIGWAAPAPFDLFTANTLEHGAVYLATVHPTALFGAIAFNRRPQLKTIGLVVAAVFATVAVTALAVRTVFHDHFTGFFTQVDPGANLNVNVDPIEQPYWWVVLAVLALLMLAASYFRFHEKEV